MVGIPAREVSKVVAEESFEPYGTPLGDVPDPDAKIIDGLRIQIADLKKQLGDVAALQARIVDLERELAQVEDQLAPVKVPDRRRPSQPATTKN
jgi:hypothetical protein